MTKRLLAQELVVKKTYENPKMEIVRIQTSDVIVTSIGATDGTDDSGWTGYY